MPLLRILKTGPLALAGLLLAAQAQPPAPAPQTTPTIKVTARQVQVSVVVRDKKGQPVSGLKKEDFVLLDKGQPQEIRYFAEEKNEAVAIPPPLPPGVFSNRIAAEGSHHSAALPNAMTMILLDGLNARYGDRARAQEGLQKFLGALRPTDHVAIYTLTNSLKVLLDFTSDVSVLQ